MPFGMVVGLYITFQRIRILLFRSRDKHADVSKFFELVRKNNENHTLRAPNSPNVPLISPEWLD